MTSKQYISYGLFFCIFVLFNQCKKDNFEIIEDSPNYIPLGDNMEWIYDVDSFDFREQRTDTFSFQEKWVVRESEIDSLGIEIGIIEVYIKNDSFHNWTFRKNFKIQKELLKIIFWDDNTPYVNLVLPIRLLNNWDINMVNNLEKNTATIQSSNTFIEYNDSLYHNVLLVTQMQYDNVIRQHKGTVKYISGIGIVEQHFINVNFTGSSIDNLTKRGYEIHRILR